MATISTLSSTNSIGISRSQTFEFENDNQGRNISFSSYLKKGEEAFVRKLADSNRSLTSDNDRLHLGNKKKREDGEIGVFEAEKYFNGVMDDEDRTPRIADSVPKIYQLKKDERSVKTTKCRIQHGTPSTVRSVSSWNSQSALLQHALRNSFLKKNKPQGKGFLASLLCKCYCSDKHAVDITDHIGEISLRKPPNYAVVQDKAVTRKVVAAGIEPKNFVSKPQAKHWVRKDVLNKVNSLDFQYVSSAKPSLDMKVQFQQAIDKEELPRKSLEVFSSPVEERNRSFSFDKRTVMLPWDTSPRRTEEIEFSVNSGGVYSDAASDASSDLFEIESLNCTTNPFLARQASSVVSGCVTPTTWYAPSEASIEWSVVTASAAEFSVFSDCEDHRLPAALASPRNIASTPSHGKQKPTSNEIQRGRPGLLLGCRSHEAVNVAGDAYKANEEPNKPDSSIRLKADSFPKVSRMYQAEAKLGNVNTMRYGQRALAAQTPQHTVHISFTFSSEDLVLPLFLVSIFVC